MALEDHGAIATAFGCPFEGEVKLGDRVRIGPNCVLKNVSNVYDRSFVMALDQGRQGAELLRAIVDLGHSLSMSVIAEGVETDEQRQFLFKNGCGHYQGHLFGKALPIREFDALLR